MTTKQSTSKLEQLAKSGAALILSRFATVALVPLLVIVWGTIQSGIVDAKLASEGARTAAAAAFAQANELAVLVAALTAHLQGEQRAQGIINDNVEFALTDHEGRVRVLEMWRVNVINREPM